MRNLTDALVDAAPETSVTPSGSHFGRGLRAGMEDLAGQTHALLGQGGELVGAQDFAAEQRAKSVANQMEAANLTADTPTLGQVNGLRSGFDYLAGMAGRSVPSLAAGLVGAKLMPGKGPVAGIAGMTAATAPSTIGAQFEAQQNDPEQANQDVLKRTLTGIGAGTGQAAAMSVVPQVIGGKLVARGVEGAVAKEAMPVGKALLNNAPEAVVGNAVAGNVSSQIGQQAASYLNPNRDTSHDIEEQNLATAEGAIMGAPFAAAGTVGDMRGARPPKSFSEPLMRSTEAERKQGVDLGTGSSFADKVSGLGSSLKSEPVTGTEHADLNLTPDDTPQTVAAKDAQGKADATAKAQRTQDKLMKDPSAAQFHDELDKIDPTSDAGQMRVSEINAQHFETQANAKNIKAANESLDKAADEFPDVHFSKDATGADAKIGSLIGSFDQDTSSMVRKFVAVGEQTGNVPPAAMRALADTLGKQTISKLTKVYDNVGSTDPAKRESFFNALAKVSEFQKADDSLLSTVRSALPPEMIDSIQTSQLKEFVAQMKDLTGERMFKDMTPAEQAVRKVQINEKLQEVFGANADKVNEAFAKHAQDEAKLIGTTPPDRTDSFGAATKADAEYEGTAQDQPADADSGITPIEQEAPRYYGGGKGAFDEKNPQFVQHRDVHNSLYGTDSASAHERLALKAEKENPGRSVDFISAKDYAKEHGIDDATLNKMTNGKPEDHGLVVAEGTKDPSRIDWKEFKEMQGQRDKNGELKSSTYDSNTRIDTVAGPIDAMQVVKAMRKKLDYTAEDDRSGSTYRLARLFHEGIAMISEHIGEAVHVPDDTVVAKFNGKELLYKDIKNVKPESSDPSWMKGKSDEQINKEIERRAALQDATPNELRQWEKKAHDIFEKRSSDMQAHIEDLRAQGIKLKGSDYKELRDKFGVGEADKAISAVEREIQTRDKGTTRERMLDSGDRSDVDPHGNVTEAAALLKAEDLQRKVGYDDNQIRHDKVNKELTAISPDRKSALETKINSLETGAGNKIQRGIAEKARALSERFDQLTPTHQQELTKIAGSKKWSEVASIVEGLTDKYQSILGKEPVKVVRDQFTAAAGEGGAQHKAIIDRVAKSTDHKGLQEAVIGLLKDRRPNENKQKVIAAMNDRISALIEKNSDVGYGLTTKGNERPGLESRDAKDEAKITTPEQRQAVVDHINKVTGGSVDVNTAAKLIYAGSYLEGGADHRPAINVSVHALDPMSVAYHESLHWLADDLRKNGDPETFAALAKVADSAFVRNFLREKFKNNPDALKQVMDSVEERVAYMYQYHANGELKLGDRGKTLVDRITDYIKKVMGVWTNDERAQHIMDYFHSGEYAKNMGDRGAVYADMMEKGRNKTLDHLHKSSEPLIHLMDSVAGIGSARIRDMDIPALTKIVDMTRKHGTREGEDAGYIPAAGQAMRSFSNKLVNRMGKFSFEEANDAFNALAENKPPKNAAQARLINGIRDTLTEMHSYLKEAGVDVGNRGLGKDYVPRQWDAAYIAGHQDEFKSMIDKYIKSGDFQGTPESLMSRLMRDEGSEMESADASARPGDQHVKKRELSFIKAEDATPFLEKDAMRVLTSYIRQGTRRAEWSRRFDRMENEGSQTALERLKEAAVKQGATPEQMKVVDQYLNGVTGQLGSDVKPETRKLFGNLMVYQNLRLLPLGFFSSLIDPIGVAVRGGGVRDVFNSFKRGITEIPRGFQKNPKYDEGYHLAEDLGVIDNAVLQHVMGASYGLNAVGNKARMVNETLFKFNLMEQMNTSQRVAATEAAMGFLKKHGKGDFNEHSTRYLSELGLKPADVKVVDGRVAARVDDFVKAGMTPEAAEKAHLKMAHAINQWVDGAVLRPDQSQKAIWMNDAHYALIAHMKQFAFAFQDTILKRILHEAKHGNYSPAVAMASYIPVMLAADLVKGAVQAGGSQPDWKQDWGLDDYLASATQRAGLFGVGQFGIDALKDLHRGGLGVGALGGPTLGQLGDIASTAGGNRQFSSTVIDSMPANSLWSGYLPKFGGKSGGANGHAPEQVSTELNTVD
jgi:hypothetical protein